MDDDDHAPHASAVMGEDGRIAARTISPDGRFSPVSVVAVAGEDLKFWWSEQTVAPVGGYRHRNAQAFGQGTVDLLRQLSIAVIGCSGTGSAVIEQLARLGVGRLLLVDPDTVEEKNLNRIINARRRDADQGRSKVDVLTDAIREMGLETEVEPISTHLTRAVAAVAECDVLFGCVDTAEGRHMLNRLACFYNLPYFDVGVRLDADGAGGIGQICGTVHYLQPDGSSLLSRGAITMEQVRAENVRRANPEEYERLEREKYIIGVNEDRPAVISVNMFYASLAVNELLARLHSFRLEGNRDFAHHGMSLTHELRYHEDDGKPCTALAKRAGRGDVCPLLEMPVLSDPSEDGA
jgi:hypothetical protein